MSKSKGILLAVTISAWVFAFGVALCGCDAPPTEEATVTRQSEITSYVWAWNGKTQNWPGVGMVGADATIVVSMPFPTSGQAVYRGAFLAGNYPGATTYAIAGVKAYKLASGPVQCEGFVRIMGQANVSLPLIFACDQTETSRIRINPIGSWTGYLDVQFVVDRFVSGAYVASSVTTLNTSWPTATWQGDSGGLVVERSGSSVPFFFVMQGSISFTEINGSGQAVTTTPATNPRVVNLIGAGGSTLVDSAAYGAGGTTFTWRAGS